MTHIEIRPRAWTVRLTAGLLMTLVCLLAVFSAQAKPPAAAWISRSAEIDAPPQEVWALIGPFCSIANWHPAIASCTEQGSPPTRTLHAKDGKTVFVEPEIGRDDAEHYYSYTFKSSPFPVSEYEATIRVVPAGPGRSTVTWSGSYVPDNGKAAQADKLFADIYEAGLAAVKAHFTH